VIFEVRGIGDGIERQIVRGRYQVPDVVWETEVSLDRAMFTETLQVEISKVIDRNNPMFQPTANGGLDEAAHTDARD